MKPAKLMTPLADAIYRTISYLDMLDFAPTALEIERYLLKTDGLSPSSLSALMVTAETDERLATREGFFFLRGRDALVAMRKKKYLWTERKRLHARHYLHLLAMMPGVRAIFLTSAMGWGNVREDSDTDFLIVTDTRKCWTARLWTTALLKLLRQRPGEQEDARALCLSFFVDERFLDFSTLRMSHDDLPLAFLTYQVTPLFDKMSRNPNDGIAREYQSANAWIGNFFLQPTWSRSLERAWIHLRWWERVVAKMFALIPHEHYAKKIQLRFLPSVLRTAAQENDQRVIINDRMLKLHINDDRKKMIDRWKQRIEQR